MLLVFSVNCQNYADALNKTEAYVYKKAYESAKYNQSLAAEFLGVSRATLRRKLKLYFGDKYV